MTESTVPGAGCSKLFSGDNVKGKVPQRSLQTESNAAKQSQLKVRDVIVVGESWTCPFKAKSRA